MTTATKNRPASNRRPLTALRRLCLIADGNAHQTALPDHRHLPAAADCISEAMLPEIRSVAMLIAAARRRPEQTSPACFTDEADWFAARIIVLNIRTLHLPAGQQFLLDTANARAAAFAVRFGLPFLPAVRRNGGSQPHHIHAECALGGRARANLFENTQALRKIVFKLPKTFPNHGKVQ